MSRMSPGTVVLGLFAVVVGVAGAYTARQYLLEVQPKPSEPPPAAAADTRTIVPVAATDLEAGKTLHLGDIALLRLTPEQLKERNISSEYMAKPDQIVGRILKAALKRGETFSPTKLYAEGTGPSVAEKLKPGLRAVTIQVHDAAGVARFAGPGTLVDLIFRSEETNDRPAMTFTPIEGVEVLALDTQLVAGSRGDKAATDRSVLFVTLGVTPAQSEVLMTLEGRGELTLALRNPQETAPGASAQKPVTLDELLGYTKPKKSRMYVYHGSSRQTIEFDEDEIVTDTLASGRPATADAAKKNVDAPQHTSGASAATGDEAAATAKAGR